MYNSIFIKTIGKLQENTPTRSLFGTIPLFNVYHFQIIRIISQHLAKSIKGCCYDNGMFGTYCGIPCYQKKLI